MKFAGLWNAKRRRADRNAHAHLRARRTDRRHHIRVLAVQAHALADDAATSEAVAALDRLVETLIGAIRAARAAGEVLPQDLEKLLARLVKKLKRAPMKRAAKRYGPVQAAGNVTAAVGIALSLFVGLHMADRAALFDEIVSFVAEQAESWRSSQSPAEPAQTVAQANQGPLEAPSPSPPTPDPNMEGGVGVAPPSAVPDITGALPPTNAAPSVPTRPGHWVPMLEDKLPTTIGNPALRAAATAGDPAAAYEVASRFAEGRGVPTSHAEEARWLERAANLGLAPAQFRLGGLYEKGIGVEKDLARARDLYLAAALKGNAKAMHNLAVLYAAGVNGAPDYETSAAWFHKAADHGIKDSQYNLAFLYAGGIGVQVNYAEAYKWFVLAANQGDGDAASKRDEVAAHLDPQTLHAARIATQSWSARPQPEDAINVKTQAAWETPADTPHPVKQKPRPAGSDTRTAQGKPN